MSNQSQEPMGFAGLTSAKTGNEAFGTSAAPALGETSWPATPADTAVGAGTGASRGPFTPTFNHLLTACFGHDLGDISVARGEGEKNRGLAAAAHTVGRHISLGDHIKEDLGDPKSTEVIAHEVAHALAKGGAGKHALDRKGDPGEHAAYDAGRQFSSFVQKGGKGTAPRLQPAYGGLAAVHRFEAGEHADAVDNAAEVAEKAGVKVDRKVKESMSSKIQLGNKLWVSPGEITAMMGDFYAAYDKDGKFDPVKSFEKLSNASAEEMEVIRGKIAEERKTVIGARTGALDPITGQPVKFKETDPGELENLTKYRKQEKDGEVVTSGNSMLELAAKNNNHFSKDKDGAPGPESKNPATDNNMGTYSAFHALALQAAKSGNMNLARGYEASAMHFLTDRFAGGHQFDKDRVTEAFNESHADAIKLPVVGDKLASGAVRQAHNEYNKNGVDVENASGEAWRAYGDGSWAVNKNIDPKAAAETEKNRIQASKTIYSSYSELEDVANGKSIEQVQKDGYAAKKGVPKFNEKFQQKVEEDTRKLDSKKLATDSVGEAAEVLLPYVQRQLINQYGEDGATVTRVSDKVIDWTKTTYGEAKQGLSNGWDFIKKTGSEALGGVTGGLSSAGSFLKNTGSEALGGVMNGISTAGSFLKNAGGEALGGITSGLSGAGSFLKNAGGQALGGITSGLAEAGSWAGHGLSEAAGGIGGAAKGAWNWLTGTASGAVSEAKQGGLTGLYNYATQKVGEAGSGISSSLGQAKDWALNKAGEAGSGLGSGLGQAKDWAVNKASEAGSGISNGLGHAKDWAVNKASEAGSSISQAGHWAKDKAGQIWDGVHSQEGQGAWGALKRIVGQATQPAVDQASKTIAEQNRGLRAEPGMIEKATHKVGGLLHQVTGW